ncbi:hypothetical protein [Mycolicibacterium gilvum]|uniref:hypothetical protein n=1 Tax=Mycolicibacterium gilvum TaxID=1804 RepID=UPI004045E9AF
MSENGCDATTFKPAGLGPRALALWDELYAEDAPVGRVVLIGEACRLTDRADKLDLLLAGDIETWAILSHRTMREDYELKIDNAASEARQTAAVLSRILTQLKTGGAESSGGSIADEIAARRAARQSDSAS